MTHNLNTLHLPSASIILQIHAKRVEDEDQHAGIIQQFELTDPTTNLGVPNVGDSDKTGELFLIP